jgi:hypothetical protein
MRAVLNATGERAPHSSHATAARFRKPLRLHD